MVARATPSRDDIVIRRLEAMYAVDVGSDSACFRSQTFEGALERAGALAASPEVCVWYTSDNTRFIALTDNTLLHRAWAEFMEMPGLGLTRLQAQRLWGVDDDTCQELLETLVALQFLVRGTDERYRRASEGPDVTLVGHLARGDPRPARPATELLGSARRPR